MKKTICLLAMLPVLTAGLFAQSPAAESTGKQENAAQQPADSPFPKNPAFHQIRSAFIPADVLENIESARMTYTFSSEKTPSSFVMIRAKRYDKVRLDILVGGNLYSSVRNGQNFWTYSQKTGTCNMDSYDARDFAQFIAFLPVPFYKEAVFDNPVFKEEETISGAVRSCFTVNTHDGSDAQYLLTVDNKTKLLRKVEQVLPAECEWGLSLQNYKTVNGVKIPGVISMASPNGNYSLTLINADWNLALDDDVFKKGANIVDANLAMLIDASQKISPRLNAEKKNNPQSKIENLQRKISKTKLEIKDIEERIAKMEQVFTANREQAVGLASVNDNGGGYRYWNGGWSSRSGSGRDSRTRRKIVKSMGKENEEIAAEHQKLTATLHKLRMNLNDYEYNLEKLQREEAAAQEKLADEK